MEGSKEGGAYIGASEEVLKAGGKVLDCVEAGAVCAVASGWWWPGGRGRVGKSAEELTAYMLTGSCGWSGVGGGAVSGAWCGGRVVGWCR